MSCAVFLSSSSVGDRPAPRGCTSTPDKRKVTTIYTYLQTLSPVVVRWTPNLLMVWRCYFNPIFRFLSSNPICVTETFIFQFQAYGYLEKLILGHKHNFDFNSNNFKFPQLDFFFTSSNAPYFPWSVCNCYRLISFPHLLLAVIK